MAESDHRATAYWVGHGGMSSDAGDRGTAGGAWASRGFIGSKGGGSGSGAVAVARRVDEFSDRRGALGQAGHRPAMALAVRARRDRWDPGPQGAGCRTLEGAGGIGRSERGAVRRGERSAELDLAALGRRDRPANRRADLKVTVERDPAGKGGFRWRRPRHTLAGRQDADAVDRAGLRLKLLRMQAA